MKRPTVFTPSGDRRDRRQGYGDRGFRHRSGPGGTHAADRDEGGNRNVGTIGEQNNGEADGFKSGGGGGGGRFRGRQPDGGGGGDDRNSPGGRRGSPPRGNRGGSPQRPPPDREQQQLGEQQQHSPPAPAAPTDPERPQQQDRLGTNRPNRRRRGNRGQADAGDDGGRQNNREAGSGRSWFRRQQGQRDGGFRGEPRNGDEQQQQREAGQQQRQSPPAQQEQPREQQQPAPAPTVPPGPERRVVLPPRRVVIPSRRVVARSGRFPHQQDQEGQDRNNRSVQDQNIGRPPQRKSTVRVQVEHPLGGQRQVYLMATRQKKQTQQNGDANMNRNQQQNNQQNDRDQQQNNYNNDDTRNNIRPTSGNANNISSRRGGERSQGGGERQQQEDRVVHGRRGQQARSRNEQQQPKQQRKPPAEEQGTSSSAPATTGQSSNEQQQMSTRELMREARDLVGVILSGPEAEEDGEGVGQLRSNKNNNKKNSSCVQFLVYQFKSRRFTYCVSVTTKNFSTSTVGSWHRLLFRKAVNLEPSAEENNNKDVVATSPLDPFKCIPCQRRVLTRCFGNQSHFLVMATRRQDATLLADGKYRYHSRLGSIVVDRKELVDSELESILVGEKSEEQEAEEEGTTSANVIPERIRIWCFPNLSPPNGHISQQVEGFQLKKIDERFYAASSEEEEEEEEEYEVGSVEESEGRRRENNSNSNAPSLVDVDEDGSLLLLTNGIQRVCTIRGPVQRVQLSPRFSDWLSQRIEEHYLRSRMPPERRRQMEQFVRDLEQLIAEKFLDPFMRLELFGSVNSGFGSDGCDLDICLVNAINETDPKLCMSKRRRILVFITELLRANPDFDQITSVLDARTPIVKFEHKPTGFHGDISVENQLALYNTELLKLYTQFDDRVAPLGFAIKRWAKVNGVNDAAAGSISSYAYVVMLIHYLQHCQPPVLPFLQEHPRHPSLPEGRVEGWEVKYAKDILTIREQQPEVFTNRQSTAQLLHGFLGYFGREFCSLTDIVQIRRRRQCTKQEANLPLRRRLCVEDPFDLDHNLTSGVREETLQYIVKCLRSTHRGLEDFERQHFAQALQQQKKKEQENSDTPKKAAEENGGTEIDEQQHQEMPTALAQMDFVKLMAHFKQRRLVRVKRKGGKKKPEQEEDVNKPDEEEEFKVPKRTKKKKMEKQRYKDFTKLLLSVDGQQVSENEEEERRRPEQSTSNEATDVPTADATADNAAHNGDANAMSEEEDKQKCPKKNFKESVVDGGQHVDPSSKNVSTNSSNALSSV